MLNLLQHFKRPVPSINRGTSHGRELNDALAFCKQSEKLPGYNKLSSLLTQAKKTDTSAASLRRCYAEGGSQKACMQKAKVIFGKGFADC